MRPRRALMALLGLLLGLQGGVARAEDLAAALAAPGAREAIARVTVAEAANQGDSGLLAVVCTILNRLADGRWGRSVDQVLNARAQFEPVLRAGGDWRALPAASPVQRARVDTLVNLVLEGRVPDPTGKALYFQNPRIVAARAAAGQVSPRLVHFGGRAPSAVIGDHAFYVETGGGKAAAGPIASSRDAIFVPRPPADGTDAPDVTPPPHQAGARGIFVLSDGGTVETRR
ncbi:cell wall hydrolase [Caulobacter endophyticus]|uniref:cell wall hydrolase n=1 Tax=Caulobacter endophyticus TaxID=2172652 RepID=UPI00240F7D0B|nr:cell wall hydrolase [Caulobacter endophyticus]MDG2528183.1 cell wall hydrolase [Caulobacter endophyticus]